MVFNPYAQQPGMGMPPTFAAPQGPQDSANRWAALQKQIGQQPPIMPQGPPPSFAPPGAPSLAPQGPPPGPPMGFTPPQMAPYGQGAGVGPVGPPMTDFAPPPQGMGPVGPPPTDFAPPMGPPGVPPGMVPPMAPGYSPPMPPMPPMPQQRPGLARNTGGRGAPSFTGPSLGGQKVRRLQGAQAQGA